MLRVAVDQYLMPYIRAMKDKYSIAYAIEGPMQFKSEYSAPLFDVANYYAEDGEHYFTLEEMRGIFNVPGNKLIRTSNFNQRVVQPALNDINTYTDLNVELKPDIRKKKIIGYTMAVQSKENFISAEQSDKERLDKILEEVSKEPYNFNVGVMLRLVDEYGLTRIENNIVYAKHKNPKNLAAYLYKAITNGYAEKIMEIKQLQAVDKAYQSEQILELQGQGNLFKNNNTEDEEIKEAEDYNQIVEKANKMTWNNPDIKEKYLKFMKMLNDKK